MEADTNRCMMALFSRHAATHGCELTRTWVDDVAQRLHVVAALALERVSPCQDLREQDAETPPVNRVVVSSLQQHLRLWRSQSRTCVTHITHQGRHG